MGTLSQESWKERGKREVRPQTLVRVWLSLNVVRSHGTVLHKAVVWSDLTFWRLAMGSNMEYRENSTTGAGQGGGMGES